jgi:FkbM family methyltransferase
VLIEFDYLLKKYKMQISGLSHFGAHLGQEVKEYKKAGSFPIHLFEPQKEIFSELSKFFYQNNDVYLYNFGLGNDNKEVEINLNTNNQGMSASILEPELHLKIHPNVTFEGKENIEIKRYDDLNINEVNFLAIDVQGYELEALKGCTKSLNNVDYILTEVNRKELYRGCVKVEELDAFLNTYNFVRVETSWWQKTIPWGDAFYIKKDLVSFQKIIFTKIINNLKGYRIYFWIVARFIYLNRFLKKILNKIKRDFL